MQSFNAKGTQPSAPEPPANNQIGFGSFLVHLFQNSSLKWLGAGVSLMLFIAVISLSYTLGVRDVEKGSVPIIVSDGSPVKVRPQNPGGKQFPYQDVSVYQSLRGEEKQNHSVILADAPEQPMEFSPSEKMQLDNKKPVNNTINLSDMNNPEKTQKTFSNLLADEEVKKSEPVEKQEVEKKPMSLNPEKELPPKEVQQIKATPAEEPAKNVISLTEKKQETAPPPMASTSSAYLQLGAYRSNAEAEGAWNKIYAKLGSALKASNHIIVKADIPGKGTYYRLRVGPYNNRLDANVVCKNISAKGQGCMPVTQ